MELHVIRKGETDLGRKLNIGDVVRYKCHVPGGMVKVVFPDGLVGVAHPLIFKELSE